jgi:hypothetical protein
VNLLISGLGDGVAPSLGTFDLDVTFDPAILAFNNVLFGNQLDLNVAGSVSGFDSESEPGVVNLFEVSLELPADLDATQASEFVLASLTFDSIGTETSLLKFENVILGDSEGNSLFADLGLPGSVTVGAPVPEPATILLLAAGIGGLGFIKRRRLMGL